MKRKTFFILAIVILLIILGCSWLKVWLSPPVVEAKEIYAKDGETLLFQHWDNDLQKYVHNGFVQYSDWKQNPASVTKTIEQLKKLEAQKIARDHLLAAYINAYNVFTVQLIFEYLPDLKSILDIPAAKRWDDVRWEVGKRKVSLNQLEHEILRKEFVEPRIHFAIVCASIGCPHLASTSYEGETLEEQLTQAAQRFFSREENLKIVDNTIYLSSILKWFEGDFVRDSLATELKWFGKDYLEAPTQKRLLMFVVRFAPREMREKISQDYGKWSIAYSDYDWNLNGK